MTPEQIIALLKSTYKKAETVSDSHGHIWNEQLDQLALLIDEFGDTLATWEEGLPVEPDQYAQHNTMSHVYQGTK